MHSVPLRICHVGTIETDPTALPSKFSLFQCKACFHRFVSVRREAAYAIATTLGTEIPNPRALLHETGGSSAVGASVGSIELPISWIELTAGSVDVVVLVGGIWTFWSAGG